MNKVIRVIILIFVSFLSLNETLAYYDISDEYTNIFYSKEYAISIDTNGGNFSNPNVVIKNNSTILPTPSKTGYSFVGYSSSSNGAVDYSVNISNIDEINNKKLYARWDKKFYAVDINPIIDGITYNSGLAGFTFDVWINNVLVADDVIDWYQNVEYGSSIRVKTNSTTGRNTNYDNTIVVGPNPININPTWTTNTYESHFYLNGVHRLTTYNKFGSTISTPNTSAGALGYDSNFYYISGYSPWSTWIQPDYAVGFTINIAEYNCTASFGTGGANNAQSQLNKIQNAGYGFCHNSSWGAVECTSNYSNVIALYNNAWNILPKSGNGYSIYKQISCDSGWSNVQRR